MLTISSRELHLNSRDNVSLNNSTEPFGEPLLDRENKLDSSLSIEHTRPLNKSLKKKIFLNSLFLSPDMVGGKLIPMVWLGLLTYDLCYFSSQPENRYGNTAIDILFGLPLTRSTRFAQGNAYANRFMLSANLGSQLPDTYTYWLGTSTIIAAPIFSRLSQMYTQRHWDKPLEISDIRILNHPINIYNYGIRWLFPQLKLPSQLGQLGFSLTHNHFASTNDEKRAFRLVTETANNSPYLAKWYALRALSHIANNRNSNSHEAALKLLNEHVNKNQKLIRFYVNYLLWSIGDKKTWAHQLFWVLPAFKVYSYLLILEVAITKAYYLTLFYQEKNQCEQADKIFKYMSHLADYACTLCGDWPFVYGPDTFTSQGCANGLLADERDPQFILNNLDRILLDPDLSELDLSKQSLTKWIYTDFKQLFEQLSESSLPYLKTLNMAASGSSPIWLQDGRVLYVANLFHRVNISRFIARGQQFGPDAEEFILQGFNHTFFDYIDLSETGLGLSEFMALREVIPTMPIRTLLLKNNVITDQYISYFKDILSNTTIQELDISNTQLTDSGIIALSEIIPTSSLNVLDISQNIFTYASMQSLGEALLAASLHTLYMSNCMLTDDAINILFPYIAKLELTTFDCSHNPITNTGGITIADYLAQTQLTELNLSYTALGNSALQKMIDVLPLSVLQKFVLSGLIFSPQMIEQLATVLSETELKSLFLSDCALSDEHIHAFIRGLSHTPNITLAEINFNHNLITSESGASLLTTLSTTPLTHFDLSDNQLGPEIGEALNTALSLSQLEEINLKNNRLDETSASFIAAALSKSRLTALHLGGNPIGDQGAVAIAQQLITPKPRFLRLQDETMTFDDSRALVHASAHTNLVRLDLSNTGLHTNPALFFCRELPETKIAIADFALNDNPIDFQAIDIQSCQIAWASTHLLRLTMRTITSELLLPAPPQQEVSSNNASSSQSSLTHMTLSLLGACMLFYMLYRALPLASPILTNTRQRFFNCFKKEENSNPSPFHHSDNINIQRGQ
jgi:Ran GTPase-activating protein (RanGAP) involved in mRNA processing and transport